MHVGDDRALRLEALDPRQRVGDAEMAGMRRIAQAVDDPEIEAFCSAGQLSSGMSCRSGVVGGIADAIAERGDVAVLQQEGGQFERAALPSMPSGFRRPRSNAASGSADSRCPPAMTKQ